jgi:hypothetical protein
MSRYRITVIVDGTVLLVRGWRVGALLRDGGFKAIYSTPSGAYMIDAVRLGDLLAYLEHRNVGANLSDADGRPVTHLPSGGGAG